MSLAYPNFLFALLALLIPIVIHLFNFRKYKRQAFTNTRFLAEVQQTTKARNQLKHLLILASRLLAVTFLVLAFAQPFIPNELQGPNAEQGKSVGIYIDNSFSMDAENEHGNLLEQAKNLAVDLANAHELKDDIYLLTNDPSRQFSHALGREEFSNSVVDLAPQGNVRSVPQVIDQFTALVHDKPGAHQLYVLSDFQEVNLTQQEGQPDSSLNILAIPVQPNLTDNLTIDSVWFERPVRSRNTPDQVVIRVTNNGSEDISNVPVTLEINGKQKAISTMSIRAGGYADSTMTFTVDSSGVQMARVGLKDHPVTFDDHYFFGFHVHEAVEVLIISTGDQGAYIKQAYDGEQLFNVNASRIDQLMLTALEQKDVVVLKNLNAISSGQRQQLIDFVEKGGSLIIFPGETPETKDFQGIGKSIGLDINTSVDSGQVGQINLQSEFFSDVFEDIPQHVDLPHMKSTINWTAQPGTDVTDLLIMENGAPSCSWIKHQLGSVYLFNAPIGAEGGTLHAHALLLPMLYQMGFFSQKETEHAYTIGTDQYMQLRAQLRTEKPLELVAQRDSARFIPAQYKSRFGVRIGFKEGPVYADNYRISQQADSALSVVGLNYPRTESNLKTVKADQIGPTMQSLGYSNVNVITTNKSELAMSNLVNDAGKPLWKWCILLALLFLAIEIALIKVLK